MPAVPPDTAGLVLQLAAFSWPLQWPDYKPFPALASPSPAPPQPVTSALARSGPVSISRKNWAHQRAALWVSDSEFRFFRGMGTARQSQRLTAYRSAELTGFPHADARTLARTGGFDHSMTSTIRNCGNMAMTGPEKLLELWGDVRALADKHADIEQSTLSPEMKKLQCHNIDIQMKRLIGVIQSDAMREICA
jgi:hypothetical protein